jgi:hypothetical protein
VKELRNFVHNYMKMEKGPPLMGGGGIIQVIKKYGMDFDRTGKYT